MTKRLFTSAIALLIAYAAQSQDTARADAPVIAATVYFGQGAELTHQTKVNVSQYTKCIVINQLSTSVDINSLQINLPENVTLLSQQYGIYTPVVPVIVNPMIKKYQDSIKAITKEQGRINNLIAIEKETLDKTNRLIEIAMQQSTNKIISGEEAIKLINTNTIKIEKSKLNMFRLSEDYTALNEKIDDLNDRISELQNKPVIQPKSYGQITLQVICSKNTEVPVSFSYYTASAGFTPLYDVRVNSKTNEIKLVYKASVVQSTGIDWKQVKLTLSTANPSWGGVAPLLTPWYLQQYALPLYNQLQPAVRNYAYNSIQSFDKKEMIVSTDNGYALQKDAEKTVDPSTLQRFTTLSESQLNTNFEIDLPYNIESDGMIHSVSIKDEKVEASLKNYAVPKLDRDAYLMAEISDWQKLDLLPGVANIIMDNTYIGKSVIDPNSTADTLNLSLGRDKRLAVKRSVVKAYTSTKTSGSSTKQTFTWEITVKNNKLTDINMLLKDQYPISNIKDVEVKLEDGGDAMINTETGILTWKIDLKPGESKKVRFTYTVKYPKEIRIANL